MIWLILDTEWSYAIYYAFTDKKPQYLPAKNIKHRQFCANASWKIEGSKTVDSVSVLDDPKQFRKDFRNDRVCALAVHKAMSDADVIVCHNADFDLKMLNVIFIFHGLDPIPQKKVICTLKVARKYFRFAGNSLDDILKFFGHSGKEEKPDWVGLTEGDPEQIKKSIFYCSGDVLGLEKILFIMKPYMIRELPKPRFKGAGQYGGIECCDACQSTRLRNRGIGGATNKTYLRVSCLECGHPMEGNVKIWERHRGEIV